jgi:hypothetical protein
MSIPTRRIRSGCCARAMTGQATADPTIPLMISRRRIAFLKAQDHANCIDDYSRDFRPAKWGSGVSLHGNNFEAPMSAFGQKRTFTNLRPTSALPPKADVDQHRRDVCFGSKADIAALPRNVRFSPECGRSPA